MGKLGMAYHLVEAHLDSWSIHRHQESKDNMTILPAILLN